MSRSLFFFILLSFSFNSYAERCEGINACTELYTKLSGHKLMLASVISDEMTVAAPDTDLTEKNASVEFRKYLNKNVMDITGDRVIAARQGEFLSAPIYVVSLNNIPRVMNPKGLVTLVYHATGDTSKLAAKGRPLLAKKIPAKNSPNKIIEFKESKIIAVSDVYDTALKAMTAIMKMDK